ncbi:hypothetical protein [Lactobacillus selangorensis]|uniref:hypothetical protein n=1 Tax=Lactobacillus selangorensis TaxID=81857 RepID=UPI000708E251|nr:hypothetical protein [Lactobacillus selangorensis]
MTVVEYTLRIEAYQLQQSTMRENLALQAWFNQSVQATTGRKKPKPKFRTFSEFYDRQAYDDEIRSAFESDYVTSHISTTNKKEHEAEIFQKRIREFKALKNAGKIVPLKERRAKNGKL